VRFRSVRRDTRGELLRFGNPFGEGIKISNLTFLSDSTVLVRAVSSIFK
jgi:hypothetical protein